MQKELSTAKIWVITLKYLMGWLDCRKNQYTKKKNFLISISNSPYPPSALKERDDIILIIVKIESNNVNIN